MYAHVRHIPPFPVTGATIRQEKGTSDVLVCYLFGARFENLACHCAMRNYQEGWKLIDLLLLLGTSLAMMKARQCPLHTAWSWYVIFGG